MLETAHQETRHREHLDHDGTSTGFVTFTVAAQVFGIPVCRVQDILTLDVIAKVPLGPNEVRGLINLRGRIVTVFDVRTRLSMPPCDTQDATHCMGVTVEEDGEFYTLLVDTVGDVVNLQARLQENNPATLDPVWQGIADGVFRTERGLMVVLDVGRLLNIRSKS
jgi:purine-binding chemotaxis protein CheW